MNGCQQVHNGRRSGTSHSEINYRDIIFGGALHRFTLTHNSYFVPSCKLFNIVAEICKQNITSKFLKFLAGISRQPILYYLFSGLHPANLINTFDR